MRLGNSEWLRGDEVEVVRGKKFVGAKGKAFWLGTVNGYRRRLRVGMELEDFGTVFLDAYNVENHSLSARRSAEEEAAKKKRAEAEAVLSVVKAKYSVIGSEAESGSGWRDNSRVYLKLLDPSRSDTEIDADLRLMFPNGSSWGALRWRAGIYDVKVDREAGVVDFIDSWGLAD